MSNSTQNKMQLIYSGCSDIGVVRQENQDSYAKLPENDSDLFNGKGQLFIVADGVGGHTGGKQASNMAVEIIGGYFNSTGHFDKTALKNAFESANAQIYDKANKSIEFNNMATTCSALFLKDNKGLIAHVGDSRIYRVQNNKIEQLTRDHTQVQELLRQGILKKDEIESYPNKSVLVRAMGAEPKVSVDIIENISINDEQYFILCSDGLGKVKEEEILNIVIKNSTEEACKLLIGLANERGGKDNVTVQVVKLTAKPAIVGHKRAVNLFPYIIITILFLIILAVVFYGHQIPFLLKTGKPQQEKVPDKKVNSQLIPSLEKTEDNSQIERADKLFSKGNIEGALSIYKSILSSEPMDLRAIKGLNNVAEYYFRKAEKLRKANDINGAVKLYYKVNEIQPDHEMSNYYIGLYRNRVNQPLPDSEKIK